MGPFVPFTVSITVESAAEAAELQSLYNIARLGDGALPLIGKQILDLGQEPPLDKHYSGSVFQKMLDIIKYGY